MKYIINKLVNNKILTISIAAYNSANFLCRCLDSILKIKNINYLDVIIVDDGSIDNTYNVALEYQNKYQGIVSVIKKSNGGWGSTINTSLSSAKGKYFKVLDSDDAFFTENLDEYIDYLRLSNSDIIYSKFSYYNINSKKLIEENDIICKMHSITFRTKMLIDNNMKITEYCFYTDVEYALKGIMYSKSSALFNKNIYIYYIGNDEQSVSDKNFIKNLDQHFKVIENLVNNEYVLITNSNSYLESSKKNFHDRLLEMINKHYSILFKICPCGDAKNKTFAFDNWLKSVANKELYNDVKLKRVLLIRICKSSFYIIYYYLKLRNIIYLSLINITSKIKKL